MPRTVKFFLITFALVFSSGISPVLAVWSYDSAPICVERNGHSVWYGAGRLAPLVAWAVRHGLIWRANRVYYGTRRLARRALKFLITDSRLRLRKGDDGNE